MPASESRRKEKRNLAAVRVFAIDGESFLCPILAAMLSRSIQYAIVDDEDLDAEAVLDGVRIGNANCTREGARLKIADIEVKEYARRRGIGTRLLQLILRAADAAQGREVWGSITAEDLARLPGLIAWYERHGFVATESDDRTLPHACRKVVRRR